MSESKAKESYLTKTVPKDRLLEILKEFKEELISLYGNRLVCLYLYGSYARRSASVDSDIDVLLVLDDFNSPYEEMKNFIEIQSIFCMKFDVLLSIFPVRQKHFHTDREPFYKSIKNEGIKI